uniref:Uncharacterized protein n=1 Tax=Romanomermis culicivorax TaxID=13658 RepID=A0A915JYS9_ROMCU
SPEGPSADIQKCLIFLQFSHLKHVYHLHDSSLWLKLSVGTAAAALIGFLIYRLVRKPRNV